MATQERILKIVTLRALTMAVLRVCICLSAFTFTFNLSAQEDNSERGRLPDGRAFRTDSDGAQLVDYIAELEQNSVEQNRKIISLEDENTSIKSELERVKTGRPDKIAEKDLVKTGAKVAEPAKSASAESWLLSKEDCPAAAECKCPEVHPAALPLDCSSCPHITDVKTVTNAADENKQSELRAQIEKLEQELLKARTERDRFAAIVQLANVKAAQNSTTEEKQNLLTVQNQKLEQELIKARSERDKYFSMLQQVNVVNKPIENRQEARASLDTDLEDTRHQAVDAIKTRMKKELQLLINRKDERDLLFAKYMKERQGGVTLNPSSLRARSGRELGQIDELLTKAETVRELAILRVDLEEIRRQMSDDLALVERMSKL